MIPDRILHSLSCIVVLLNLNSLWVDVKHVKDCSNVTLKMQVPKISDR